jgi:hypothetical protein
MKTKILISFIVALLFVSCGKESPSSETTASNSPVEQKKESEEKKEISAKTKAKIEKWKKETTASTKRLSANEFAKYDLSVFWKTSYSLGYIGNNYQRLYITFEKVRKISSTEYRVEGFSQVKSNVCNFTGVIKNIEYNQYKVVDYDCSCADLGIENPEKQGCLFADFVIEEDASQKNTGVFLGMLEAQWIIDTNGQLHKGQVGCGSSQPYSDQFLGEWISYKGGSKPVAWGEGEIPLARGLLYQGDGDICISAKYHNNGWEEFERCDLDYFY